MASSRIGTDVTGSYVAGSCTLSSGLTYGVRIVGLGGADASGWSDSASWDKVVSVCVGGSTVSWYYGGRHGDPLGA